MIDANEAAARLRVISSVSSMEPDRLDMQSAAALLEAHASVLAARDAQIAALQLVRDAYEELTATVKGECPSLLNEDSGASQVLLDLIVKADAAIAALDARQEGDAPPCS